MNFCNIILSFLTSFLATGQPANIDEQYELIEHFLTVKNIDIVVLYACWSFKGTGLCRYYNIICTYYLVVKYQLYRSNDKYEKS